MKNHPTQCSQKKLKIFCLFGDGGRYAGQMNDAPTHSMVFSNHFFDDYMRMDDTCLSFDVNRELLNDTAEEVFSGHWDAIFCDANDAILLQYFAYKRNLEPVPFIINEVDLLESAIKVHDFIRLHYGDDFFRRFVRSKYNFWMTVLQSRTDNLNSLGIPKSRIYYLPICSPVIEFFFPDFFKKRTGADIAIVKKLKNKIIAPGTHNRDFSLLAHAAEGTGLEIHLITNLAINRPFDTPELVWHDSLPEPAFVEALSNSGGVVVTLIDSNRAAGQLACAVPMKFGKLVITADCASVNEHIIDGKTGILYKAEDSESLRSALLLLARDKDSARLIGEAARARESDLSEIAASNIAKLLERIRSV